MTQTLTGGCLCGAVRYTARPGDRLHYLCHCTDCQRWGGTAWHTAIVVADEDIAIEGVPRVYAVTADSGRQVARHFCGTCGGHLFTSPWPQATRWSVKAGTLDDPSLYRPAHEIWCQSRAAWLPPTGTEHFEQGFSRPVAIGKAAVRDEDDKF